MTTGMKTTNFTKSRMSIGHLGSKDKPMAIRQLLLSHNDFTAVRFGREVTLRVPVKRPRWAQGRDIELDKGGVAMAFDGSQEGHAWISCPYANLDIKWGATLRVSYLHGRVFVARERGKPKSMRVRVEVVSVAVEAGPDMQEMPNEAHWVVCFKRAA